MSGNYFVYAQGVRRLEPPDYSLPESSFFGKI
jgi:hypothetical protein